MGKVIMTNIDSTSPTYNLRINLFTRIAVASLLLAACSPKPTPNVTSEVAAPAQALPTAATAIPTLTIPPATATQLPPTPTPECPGPGQDKQLLRNEAFGYCFLYPEDYIRVDPLPYEICLVPNEPYLVCHTANLILEVEEAAGRTANQIADEIVADAESAIPGIMVKSTTYTVSGEQAVVLEGLPGVDLSRIIFIVHADRVYKLTFVPWDATGEEFARIKTLYTTVINSFTFIP